MKERVEDLRKKSGEVSYSDPLTTFFYLLMRNELAAGKVEELVRESVDCAEECLFTNGWLAHYANNLAEDVKNARVTQLQKALDQAFTFTEVENREQAKQEEQDEIKEKLKNASSGKSFGDDELEKLEQQLIEAAEAGNATPVAKDVDANITSEEALGAILKLVAEGHITQNKADDIASDIKNATDDIPKAEEVVKENKEEDKVTVEEAKEIVDHAVELANTIEALVEHAVEGAVEEIKEIEDLQVIKNDEEISDEEWKTEHVTLVNINKEVTDDELEKWKKTNEELQKQDEKESTTEEE